RLRIDDDRRAVIELRGRPELVGGLQRRMQPEDDGQTGMVLRRLDQDRIGLSLVREIDLRQRHRDRLLALCGHRAWAGQPMRADYRAASLPPSRVRLNVPTFGGTLICSELRASIGSPKAGVQAKRLMPPLAFTGRRLRGMPESVGCTDQVVL